MPTTYTAPGVYVEEVPSSVQPIAGVGTSTAGFIGIVPDKIIVPFSALLKIENEETTSSEHKLQHYPVVTEGGTFTVTIKVPGKITNEAVAPQVTFDPALPTEITVRAKYQVLIEEEISTNGEVTQTIPLKERPALGVQTKGEGKLGETNYTWTASQSPNTEGWQATFTFASAPPKKQAIKFTYNVGVEEDIKQGPPYHLNRKPVVTRAGTYDFSYIDSQSQIKNDSSKSVAYVEGVPKSAEKVVCSYLTPFVEISNEIVGKWNDNQKVFPLKYYPVADKQPAKFAIGGDPFSGILKNDPKGTAYVDFSTVSVPASKVGATIMGDYLVDCTFAPKEAQKPILCTSFTEFKRHFGGFSVDPGQRQLVHAVQGFFLNGGTRCYVMRVAQEGDITNELLKQTFAPIDEITLVVAPGITGDTLQVIVDHCKNMEDRFAILDCAETIENEQGEFDATKLQALNTEDVPQKSDYAAFYAPWIQVSDPASQILYPEQKEKWRITVPPSGHIAGIYARVDNDRGVHKAPANEPIRGALGLKYGISRAQQEGLNPIGVNCIRDLNGSILVWGARTIGGDINGECKYINVRRLFLYLRESIDEGTQWVVFEPNTPALWAKITRNITAFLTNVWRAGALFGNTPQEAFYVKCDAETNPFELREVGQVVTEIGVAVAKPAEFVIFRISQWAGPSK